MVKGAAAASVKDLRQSQMLYVLRLDVLVLDQLDLRMDDGEKQEIRGRQQEHL